MIFRQLFDKESSTYTYLVADSVTREAALVDPVLEQVERDLQLIQELNLSLKFCLETHIHADHITGTGELRKLTGCKGILPLKARATCADFFIRDGEIRTLGKIEIKALDTPGHTDSHMAYLINGDRVLTGDAIFIRGCGRTDFQSGDAGTLYDSVTKKLFTLPDETLVYPAHDYRGRTVSTIGEEKKWNPRFVERRLGEVDAMRNPQSGSIRDRNSFIQLMNNLNLQTPQKMMEAVPANQSCGMVSAAAIA